jgi:hypothetical protein
MAELKTRKNDASVVEFLNRIADEQKRRDAFTILELMQQVTREEPKMWGGSIVGFGSYHYKYDSGHEGDMCVAGFSPRKEALTLYIATGVGKHAALMKKLGKHKVGKACLYIKRLEDVSLPILKKLIAESVRQVRKSNKCVSCER